VGELSVTGLPRIGAGREAEVFALGPGRALRLARTAALREAVDRERVALQVAARCGAPAPMVFERVDVAGRPGLVVEHIDGHDLLTGLVRRPWELVLMPSVLASLHASLHEIAAPTQLPDLHTEVAERLRSDLVPSAIRHAGLRALQRLPGGDRLCHGDFHPGNVLRRPRGGYAMIDWKAASRGDPAGDVARARLLMVEAWIPGAGPRRLQLVLAPFRRALYIAYLRAYRRRHRLDLDIVAAWVPVLAAARLSYDIPDERGRMLAIAHRDLRERRPRAR
jgi:aminoglycoside phosphotransferase (APT) family kinase protein